MGELDLERLRAEVDGCECDQCRIKAALLARVAELETERDAHVKAVRECRNYWMGRPYEARRELAAMRPVVEAAEAWRTNRLDSDAIHAVVTALDAYRAAQKAPLDRPESTESQDQAEVAVASTNTAQAQRGIQAIEYRDPDAHWPAIGPNDAAMMVCNKCGGQVWTGDDGWACPCDGAMFEYAKPEPPANPPGLDAAIEAARQAYEACDSGDDFDIVAAAVRAAAPALRAGALREAADDFDRTEYFVRRENETEWERFTRWLRERAEEGGDGN